MVNGFHSIVFAVFIVGCYHPDIVSAEPPARPPAEGERPLKRAREECKEKTVPTLKELAAKTIVHHNHLMLKPLFARTGDCLDTMKPYMMQELTKKFAPDKEKRSRIASMFHDSKAYSLKGGNYILCFQPRFSQLQIYKTAEILHSPRDLRSTWLGQKFFFDLIYQQKRCFRRPLPTDDPRILGFLYCIANQTMERFAFSETFQKSQSFITSHYDKITVSPALSGIIEIATPYFKSLLVKTSAITVSPSYIQNIFLVNPDGRSECVVTYRDRASIRHLRQGAGTSFFVLFSDGIGEYYDSLGQRPRSFPLYIPKNPRLQPIHFEISPSGTKVVAGFEQGKMAVYDSQTLTRRIITDTDQRECGPMHFLDNDTIIVARNPRNRLGNQQIDLQIWDLAGSRLAQTTQQETLGINNIDLDPDNQVLVLGMGRYDIGRQTINSFTPILDNLDPEKIFSEPHTMVTVLQKPSLTLKDKLNFLTHYAKRG